jgi:predicted site-specific integrase-resolvase
VPKSQWLTIVDYASKVGKSTDTVRRWIRGGLLETKAEGHTRLILFNPGA